MKKLFNKFLVPITGLIALIWVLIRVIPKPSRATYPCIQAVSPMATSFVLYLLSFFSSIIFFKKARAFAIQQRYTLFIITFALGSALGLYTLLQSNPKTYANTMLVAEGPNEPMGEGYGINPGRVAWIFDANATNGDYINNPESGNYWYQDVNTDQSTVSQMLKEALLSLTNAESDTAAWDAIFRYHNQQNGKGDAGYQATEKIAIKININNGTSSGYTRPVGNRHKTDTSPQIVYAILDQLVNIAGVPQENIGIGDPGKNTDDIYWDKCQPDFPDVKFWGNAEGRTPVVQSENEEFHLSDGSNAQYIPQNYIDAEYMINIPILKKHHRAGISLAAKNHFGMLVPFYGDAFHMHFSLPAPDGWQDVTNGEYGSYRCFVDIMGHRDIGAKTILYLVDGLWGSTNWGHPPIKWAMAPFNNDWPSSIFISQDPVAIESVGFDFLYEEFDDDHPTEGSEVPVWQQDDKGPFSHFAAADDYLHQAADSNNWPVNVSYDPENDGTPLKASLGTHEHWNNARDKQYSRNLGEESGIELRSNLEVTSIENKPSTGVVSKFQLSQNYPNPFNGTTNIVYKLSAAGHVQIKIFNALGQEVKILVNEFKSSGNYIEKWHGLNSRGVAVPSGIYMYRMQVSNASIPFQDVKRMVYVK